MSVLHIRDPKEILTFTGRYPRNPHTSRSILPQEEIVMQDYARAKVRVKEHAHHKRARAVYCRVLEQHPEIAESDRHLRVSERCISGALALLVVGVFFVLGFYRFLPIVPTLAGLFGFAALLFLHGLHLSFRAEQSDEAKQRSRIFAEAAKWVDTSVESSYRRYAIVLNEWKQLCNGRPGRRYWARFEDSSGMF